MSNQVYRDKPNAIPYDGEQYTYNISLTGSGGVGSPVGFIGVHLTRLNLYTTKMSIVNAQVGVNWNGSTTLTSAVGAVPLGFRPATETWQYISLLLTTGTPLSPTLASFYIDGAGTIVIRRVDSLGAAVAITAGMIVGLQDIIWITNP